jgi:hypothetical protein
MTTIGSKQGVAGRRAQRQAGLTLSETMVASAVFSLTVIGFVYLQMFGMRQDQLVNSKIGASEQARLSFNELGNDVRAAKIWQIGNGNLSSFTGIAQGIDMLLLSFRSDEQGKFEIVSHSDKTGVSGLLLLTPPYRHGYSSNSKRERRSFNRNLFRGEALRPLRERAVPDREEVTSSFSGASSAQGWRVRTESGLTNFPSMLITRAYSI